MAASVATRPRGRRPGHDDTRGTIRAAAGRRFRAQGYDRVSLRAIAREADVDPALVHHYFASKSDLFDASVLELGLDVAGQVDAIVEGDQALVGRRAVKVFFDRWDDVARRSPYLEALQGFCSGDGTCKAINEFLAREVFAAVAVRYGHSNALLRGQLATSAILGVVMARQVLELPVVSTVTLRTLTGPLGGTLQRYLVDPW